MVLCFQYLHWLFPKQESYTRTNTLKLSKTNKYTSFHYETHFLRSFIQQSVLETHSASYECLGMLEFGGVWSLNLYFKKNSQCDIVENVSDWGWGRPVFKSLCSAEAHWGGGVFSFSFNPTSFILRMKWVGETICGGCFLDQGWNKNVINYDHGDGENCWLSLGDILELQNELGCNCNSVLFLNIHCKISANGKECLTKRWSLVISECSSCTLWRTFKLNIWVALLLQLWHTFMLLQHGPVSLACQE